MSGLLVLKVAGEIKFDIELIASLISVDAVGFGHSFRN